MAGFRKRKGRQLWSVGAAKRRRDNYEARRTASGDNPGWQVAAVSGYLQAIFAHTDPVLATALGNEVIAVGMDVARRAENANLAAAVERTKASRSRKEQARDHSRDHAA